VFAANVFDLARDFMASRRTASSSLLTRRCADEFARHDVDATTSTMVEQPYVLHLPTLGLRRTRGGDSG